MVLFGELPALRHGGDVGAVAGDDCFEDVACFGDVVGFGDGQDEVLLFSAGHRHVQPAPVVAGVARVMLPVWVSDWLPGSVAA